MSDSLRKQIGAGLLITALALSLLLVTGRGLPSPPPVPGEGFHVLIVEETEQRGTLSSAQADVLFSPELRKWMTSQGATWRIWDKDVDATNEPDPWFREAIKLPQASLPGLVISNGRTGFHGPLPADRPSAQSKIGEFVP